MPYHPPIKLAILAEYFTNLQILLPLLNRRLLGIPSKIYLFNFISPNLNLIQDHVLLLIIIPPTTKGKVLTIGSMLFSGEQIQVHKQVVAIAAFLIVYILPHIAFFNKALVVSI